MHVLTPLILALSTAYALAAVWAFQLVYGPFAGLNKLGEALVFWLLVTTPYALLYAAHQKSREPVGRGTVAAMTIAAAVIGAFLYFFSFSHNDGEYALVYIITPILQSPFVAVAIGVVLWKRKRSDASAI